MKTDNIYGDTLAGIGTIDTLRFSISEPYRRLNVVFDYKYFQDESFNEIESSAKPRTGGFLNRTGLGAAVASAGGRAISGLSPRTQQTIGGAVGGFNAVRVASKLFF